MKESRRKLARNKVFKKKKKNQFMRAMKEVIG